MGINNLRNRNADITIKDFQLNVSKALEIAQISLMKEYSSLHLADNTLEIIAMRAVLKAIDIYFNKRADEVKFDPVTNNIYTPLQMQLFRETAIMEAVSNYEVYIRNRDIMNNM